MAVDTATKRYSMLGIDLPFVRLYPVPDGTVSATDRQQFVWKYSGIAFGAPSGSITKVSQMMMMGMS